MPALVDPKTLATNLAIILGALFVLGTLSVFGFVAWTATRMIVTEIRKRRAMAKWKKASHRADGKPYPACIEGVCETCGRGSRWTYFPKEVGRAFCPACYEKYWRETEGYVDLDPALAPTPNRQSMNQPS